MAQFKLVKSRAQQGAPPATVPLEDDFAVMFPALWQHLTATTWEDGSARPTSSVLLFAEAGKMKAMLADKGAGLVCFVTGNGVRDVAERLETQLQEGTCDWRQDRNKRASVR